MADCFWPSAATRWLLILLRISITCLLCGCLPKTYPSTPPVITPKLLDSRYLTADGTILPLRMWPSPQQPEAILIAVHGFNDYSHFFQDAGLFFSQRNIACYAYDQRGFGGSPVRGFWAGNSTLSSDLAIFIRLIKNKHPHVPLYVLGESMGAAVLIDTLPHIPKQSVAGIILSAPAVWNRNAMPWYQQMALWTLAHSMPSLTLTGRGLKILASDNIPMLKTLGKDPLIIKATRVDALYGLATVMDTAQKRARQMNSQTLLLYGEHDQLIPKMAVGQFISNLLATNGTQTTIALYKDGYHMLLRDLHADIVLKDIQAWLKSPTKIPSGADIYAKKHLIPNLP